MTSMTVTSTRNSTYYDDVLWLVLISSMILELVKCYITYQSLLLADLLDRSIRTIRSRIWASVNLARKPIVDWSFVAVRQLDG